MTTREQLQLIQRTNGWTQAEAAHRLGVTVAAYNRWANGHAAPRAKARIAILGLAQNAVGTRTIPDDPLAARKLALRKKAARAPRLLRALMRRSDLHDTFMLKLTYTSNRLEGSTLTEGETARVLFEHRGLPSKNLVDQIEARNHAAAFDELLRHLSARKAIDEKLVLRLHALLKGGVDDSAGFYRTRGVRIMGSHVPTANPVKIPDLMERLMPEFRTRDTDVIRRAAMTHARFEQIHPFADGNGRAGRLLLQALLLRSNHAPAVIQPRRRNAYLAALHAAQTGGGNAKLELFLCDAVEEGWKLLQGML